MWLFPLASSDRGISGIFCTTNFVLWMQERLLSVRSKEEFTSKGPATHPNNPFPHTPALPTTLGFFYWTVDKGQ